jgi:hypothetical protein
VTRGAAAFARVARCVKPASRGALDLDHLDVGHVVNRLDFVPTGAKRVFKGRVERRHRLHAKRGGRTLMMNAWSRHSVASAQAV